jgi:hypothetical protein
MSIDGINTRDISFNLGHSSISITDEYLKTGFNSKRVDAVQKKFEDYIGNFEN